MDGLEDAIVAVEVSYAGGYIFWTDVTVPKIKRISFREKRRIVKDVVSFGLRKPEGLAVDWVARKLYWTDCGMQIGKRIESKWQILTELTEKSYYGEIWVYQERLLLTLYLGKCDRFRWLINFLIYFIIISARSWRSDRIPRPQNSSSRENMVG